MEGEGINAQPGLNCTIPVVTDEMYHLLEFYVHHDSPLSCRVRARPQGSHRALIETEEGDSGSGGIEWVPLSMSSSVTRSLVSIAADERQSSVLPVNLNRRIYTSPTESTYYSTWPPDYLVSLTLQPRTPPPR